MICADDHMTFQLQEREMEEQLEAREEGNLEIKETFSTLKEEVASKTKKLNKVRPSVWGRSRDVMSGCCQVLSQVACGAGGDDRERGGTEETERTAHHCRRGTAERTQPQVTHRH